MSSSGAPDVTIVVVSYMARDWLERCLGAIPAAAGDRAIEVIVVDNDSPDGSADMVEERYPWVDLVRNAENTGFGRAVNLGAARARGEYVLLLNPDGYLHDGALDRLVSFAEAHPEYVVCGGRTSTPDGDADPRSCWGAPTLWSVFCIWARLTVLSKWWAGFDPEAMPDYRRDHEREVDIVSGALLLIRRRDWEALGGFDERFFMYGEDADLCLRATAGGRRCAITPKAEFVHAVSASSAMRADKLELLLRGRITLTRKHWPAWRHRAGLVLVVGGVAARAGIERLRPAAEQPWSEVWRRRRQWWRGYPAVADGGPATPPAVP